jgi:hypothetical protein
MVRELRKLVDTANAPQNLRQLVDTANAPIFGTSKALRGHETSNYELGFRFFHFYCAESTDNFSRYTTKFAIFLSTLRLLLIQLGHLDLVSTFIVPNLRKSVQDILQSSLKGTETSHYELEFRAKTYDINRFPQYVAPTSTTRHPLVLVVPFLRDESISLSVAPHSLQDVQNHPHRPHVHTAMPH